jgi:ERCC4-type nuclease
MATLKGERREQKRTRAVAKQRRKSNIKSLMVMIHAREKRLSNPSHWTTWNRV